MPPNAEIFRRLLDLRGKNVHVGLKAPGEVLRGVVEYVSFDSFLLQEERAGNRVVSFDDIAYLTAAPSS